MGYNIESVENTSYQVTLEQTIPPRNRLARPARARFFFTTALSLILATSFISDSIISTDTPPNIRFAKQETNRIKGLLDEYVAFVSSEDIVVSTDPIRINRDPAGLEKFSLRSLVSGKGKEGLALFESINTYDSNGAFLTASLTTNQSRMSFSMENSTNEEFLRQAFNFPPEDDAYKAFSCRSFEVGPETLYRSEQPIPGIKTDCQIWMDKRTTREIENWKFEMPENLQFTATIDPTGNVSISVVDMRTLSCALPPFK